MASLIARLDGARGRNHRAKKQALLENLESRLLMSAITTSTIGAVSPFGIAQDNAGNIWVAGGDGLYKVGPDGQQIGAPAATGSVPFDVAFDPVNQHLYFSDQDAEQIVEVGLDGTVLNTYTVPNLSSESPELLTVATDGSVWFSTAGESTGPNSYTAEIGRLDLSGNFSFAQVPGGGASIFSVAASPDGSVWFGATGFDGGDNGDTRLADAGIGHAHAGSDGTITIDPLYAVSTPASVVTAVTVASDDSVWFGLANSGAAAPADGPNRIVHGVLVGSTLVQTEYVIPQGASDAGDPIAGDLALDGSGRLWFTDQNNDRLSYMDTATGDFTQMALPSTIADPLLMTITSTDVWATAETNGTDNLIQLDLSSFSPPIVATAPNINATVGVAYTGTLTSFVTADDGAFSYSIDYGNGQTQSGSMAGNASGMYSIPSNVTYAAAGTYATSVTITSADGDVATTTGVAVATAVSSNPVTGAGINLSGAQDTALAPNRTISGQPALAVATFSGPAATYSASITWGDGTSTSGTIANLGGGMYAVLIASGTTKTYHANGTFTGSVVISGGPNTLTVGFTAAISDTPLVVSTGLKLQPLLGRIVLADTANFSDDIESSANWFTATINWGDGTTSAGLVVGNPFNPGTYFVIGLHVYAKKGTYTVLTLIDNTHENVTATATATIKIN